MKFPIDYLISEHKLANECGDDAPVLLKMVARAKDYIAQFHWSPNITEAFVGYALDWIVAAVLIKFEKAIESGQADEQLWVIVGDLPSAYLVVDSARDGREALERYCELMTEWITAVEEKQNLDDVFPVDAIPSPKNVEALKSRIRFIRSELIS